MIIFGGVERIRTAVQGFAGLCLTTRPRHLNYYSETNEKL